MKKYLRDMNIKYPPTQKGKLVNRIYNHIKFFFQRRWYGFDEREIYTMDTSFYLWVYQRVSMYLDKTDKDLDDTNQKFYLNNRNYTKREILEILQYKIICIHCEKPLSTEYRELHETIMYILEQVLPYIFY